MPYDMPSPPFEVPEVSAPRRVKPLPKRRRTTPDGPDIRSNDAAHPIPPSAFPMEPLEGQMFFEPIHHILPPPIFPAVALPLVDLNDDQGQDYVDQLVQPGKSKKRKVPVNTPGSPGHDVASTDGRDDDVPSPSPDRDLSAGPTAPGSGGGTIAGGKDSAEDISLTVVRRRRTRMAAVTLAGLHHKELLKTRKRQLATVLGAVSSGDTLALDQALLATYPFALSPLDLDLERLHQPPRIHLSRRPKAYMARHASLRHPDQTKTFPTCEFTFKHESETAKRLIATKEEVAVLRSRFEQELARQASKAAQATAAGRGTTGTRSAKERRASKARTRRTDAPPVAAPRSVSSGGSKSKKKKRSALANASNPHHLRNYVPSRVPQAGNPNQAAAQVQNSLSPLPLRFLAAEVPPRRRRKNRPAPSSVAVVNPAEEWICAFCEYELFYGEDLEYRRAIRNRKKILRRRRRARERASAAASGHGVAPKVPEKNVVYDDGDREALFEKPHDQLPKQQEKWRKPGLASEVGEQAGARWGVKVSDKSRRHELHKARTRKQPLERPSLARSRSAALRRRSESNLLVPRWATACQSYRARVGQLLRIGYLVLGCQLPPAQTENGALACDTYTRASSQAVARRPFPALSLSSPHSFASVVAVGRYLYSLPPLVWGLPTFKVAIASALPLMAFDGRYEAPAARPVQQSYESYPFSYTTSSVAPGRSARSNSPSASMHGQSQYVNQYSAYESPVTHTLQQWNNSSTWSQYNTQPYAQPSATSLDVREPPAFTSGPGRPEPTNPLAVKYPPPRSYPSQAAGRPEESQTVDPHPIAPPAPSPYSAVPSPYATNGTSADDHVSPVPPSTATSATLSPQDAFDPEQLVAFYGGIVDKCNELRRNTTEVVAPRDVLDRMLSAATRGVQMLDVAPVKPEPPCPPPSIPSQQQYAITSYETSSQFEPPPSTRVFTPHTAATYPLSQKHSPSQVHPPPPQVHPLSHPHPPSPQAHPLSEQSQSEYRGAPPHSQFRPADAVTTSVSPPASAVTTPMTAQKEMEEIRNTSRAASVHGLFCDDDARMEKGSIRTTHVV
ncbi:hypothetical protein FISHEDRAFT_61505 [Fistulina hepatica ATCC 64428]|uniref:Uncharacterized protein n=1 Tax=Fistulina hepatica ATCC 64428 TaxID=1128425 RepID=A0A0D7A517_9AGAR|nr:hypothetical protein FISHEDRAFT_61505 [Fistulina hepatica ATCC 64428]